MIDQALNLLSLYIMWKTRGLTSATDPSPEEIRFREKLKASRDVLLEKLLEFAVGTQSNTSEGVRRAVRLFYSIYISISRRISILTFTLTLTNRRSKIS